LPGARPYTKSFEGMTKSAYLSSKFTRLGVTYYDSSVIYQPTSFTAKLLEVMDGAFGPAGVADSVGDKNKDIRRNAVYVLGQLKREDAIQVLIHAFRDEDPAVKAEAVAALANIGQPAIEPLKYVLRDKDMVVRRHATTALAQIADPNSIKPWIDALRDDDPKVQETAAMTLVKAGPAAMDPLIAALNDNDRYFRKSVTRVLGEMKDPKGLEPLSRMLRDKDPGVQKAAADALVSIGSASIDVLADALKDATSTIRLSAAWALGEIKDPKCADVLIPALKDKDRLVRVGVVMALATIGDKRATAPLTEAMDNKALGIHDECAKALQKLK
jgi:HEAT repeat protein